MRYTALRRAPRYSHHTLPSSTSPIGHAGGALLDFTLAHRSPPLWAGDRTVDCALNLGSARWRFAEPVSPQGQRFVSRQPEDARYTIHAVGEPWRRSLSRVPCKVKQGTLVLVSLVGLVCFVYLVDLVHLVSFVQPKNQTDQTNQRDWRTFSAFC